jgi:hypothetical protein
VSEDSVRITSGEPTPLQLSAWRRLWAILLAPAERKSPATVSECTAKPETAAPGGEGRAANAVGQAGAMELWGIDDSTTTHRTGNTPFQGGGTG